MVVASAITATMLTGAPASAKPVEVQAPVAVVAIAGPETGAASDPITNPNVTQSLLDVLAEEKPLEYEAAQQAVAPFVAEGEPLSAVPAEVVASLDGEIWATFLVHERALESAAERGTVLTDEEQASQEEVWGIIWRIIKEFIKRNWSRIKNAAVRSGKWAWYKGGRCIAGATNGLYRFTGGNAAILTIPGNREAAIGAAARGCISYL